MFVSLVNQLHCLTGSIKNLLIKKILMIVFATCFAAYQMAYWCLGWMPDDWGKDDEFGDWLTFRSSLSGIFSIYGGLFFLGASLNSTALALWYPLSQKEIETQQCERGSTATAALFEFIIIKLSNFETQLYRL